MTQDIPKPGGRHGEIQYRDLAPQRVEDVGRTALAAGLGTA
jgi:hypothetical protein